MGDDKKNIPREGKTEEDGKGQGRVPITLVYIGGIILICAVGLAIRFWTGTSFKEREANAVSGGNTVILTEKERDTEKKTENMPETEAKRQVTEQAETENVLEGYVDVVFGQMQGVLDISGGLHITGLTEAQREEFENYRESDLIREVCSFLSRNGYKKISKIEFLNKIQCSSGNAVAYEAVINGDMDKVLNIIYYPEFSQYLFTLQEAKVVTVEIKETENQLQTEAVQFSTVQQNPPESEPQETQGAYDASRLSVQGIPSILLNYISNQYDLQYSLYGYLYNNGYRNVTVAEITGYEVDPDTREAEFTIRLNDNAGTTLKGIYDKNNNSYMYTK